MCKYVCAIYNQNACITGDHHQVVVNMLNVTCTCKYIHNGNKLENTCDNVTTFAELALSLFFVVIKLRRCLLNFDNKFFIFQPFVGSRSILFWG